MEIWYMNDISANINFQLFYSNVTQRQRFHAWQNRYNIAVTVTVSIMGGCIYNEDEESLIRDRGRGGREGTRTTVPAPAPRTK